MKKDHFDKYIRAMEQQKKNKVENMERLTRDRIENSCQLQLAIYKTMEDTDSLLEMLSLSTKTAKKGIDCVDDGKNMTIVNDPCSSEKTEESMQSKQSSTNAKKSKDESMVIEELRTLNHQLHGFVFQLVSQLDEVNQESETLRDKIKTLERGGRTMVAHSVIPKRHIDITHNGKPIHNMVVPESVAIVSDISSSTVDVPLDEREQNFLSCEPISLDMEDDIHVCATSKNNEIIESSSELPPLELPTFDFTTFDCKE